MIGALLGCLRAVSQLHEKEPLVVWARTRGRWAVLALAAALLAPFMIGRFVIPAIALIMWKPARRRVILSLAAPVVGGVALFEMLAGTGTETAPADYLALGIAELVLLTLLFLCFLAARHFSRLPGLIRGRPQVWLHLVVWSGVAVFWLSPEGEKSLGATVWTLVVAALPFLVWRCGYLLAAGKRGTVKDSRFRDHLYYLWPAYGGSDVPQGKGFDHLSKCEVASSEAFARSQLAGIKLLLLAWLWKGGERLLAAVAYGNRDSLFSPWLGGFHLGIPSAAAMMDPGADYALPLVWTGLYVELVRITLWLAGWGHAFVGALRLCGYNVFRNTYKPLLAETLLDFWNRFYYYFKELLVEFFFFPTYLRFFKTRPRLRLFAAIFAAAFVGNVYYHVLSNEALIAADFARLSRMLESYTIYCFLLAVGVSLSMIRQQKKRGRITSGSARFGRLRRVRRIASVWTFYSLIHIWDGHVDFSLFDRTRFFLSLFGLQGLMTAP